MLALLLAFVISSCPYYISNNVSTDYVCSKYLGCTYSVIISNSKDVTIDCPKGFNTILVYNSTNIEIRGNGIVIFWYSTGTHQCIDGIKNIVYSNDEQKILTLVCVPIGLYVKIYARHVPKGVFGKIILEINATKNFKNILVELKSNCHSIIKAIDSTKPTLLAGNKVYFNSLSNETINVTFGFIPLTGTNCALIVDIRSNENPLINKEKVVSIVGGNPAYTKRVQVSEVIMIITPLLALLLLIHRQ